MSALLTRHLIEVNNMRRDEPHAEVIADLSSPPHTLGLTDPNYYHMWLRRTGTGHGGERFRYCNHGDGDGAAQPWRKYFQSKLAGRTGESSKTSPHPDLEHSDCIQRKNFESRNLDGRCR